jgi:hypothetical protein
MHSTYTLSACESMSEHDSDLRMKLPQIFRTTSCISMHTAIQACGAWEIVYPEVIPLLFYSLYTV